MAETPDTFDVIGRNPIAIFQDAFENNLFKLVDGLCEKLESGVEFLDVGCGEGGLLRVLAKRFPKGRYLGIESIHTLVADANKEVAASDLANCTYDVQNAVNLPEKWTGRFDIVLLHNVFHDLSNPQKAAGELLRVVKDNGQVLVVDLNLEPNSELARTSTPLFTASNMYYCIPGDMGADGSIPIGCVRTGDAMEEILKAFFPTVDVSRVSDSCIVHVCSK